MLYCNHQNPFSVDIDDIVECIFLAEYCLYHSIAHTLRSPIQNWKQHWWENLSSQSNAQRELCHYSLLSFCTSLPFTSKAELCWLTIGHSPADFLALSHSLSVSLPFPFFEGTEPVTQTGPRHDVPAVAEV